MELSTKYQYTYFIYPYIIEKKHYTNYIYSLLNKKKCRLKLFEHKKDIGIDTYFLPKAKEKMFWTMELNNKALKSYNDMDKKLKARVLSKKESCFFEYILEEDLPAKIGQNDGIFFDINKIEIACFSTGVCFLLIKTVLNEGASFQDVLNFNYKFRDIQSKLEHTKEYENIKIQTQKFQNMQTFSEFVKEIAGVNILAKKINIDTNRLITYSYTCLDPSSWNENTNRIMLEKEFEKYQYIKPAGEQIHDVSFKKENVYQEKYLYYGFSNSATVLLTSASNIKNYTNLLFEYENEQLYHFLYYLHQKIYLKKMKYNFNKAQFLEFIKKDFGLELTNDIKGVILEKYFKQAQNLDETIDKLKKEYDLLYKEYNINKVKRHNKCMAIIIAVLLIINLIKIIFKF